MITIGIIVITCLVSIGAFSNAEIMQRLMFTPYIIKRQPREAYRLFSSALIHADFMHLGVNMLVLYSFGQLVEGVYGMIFPQNGKILYVVMYVLAAGASSISSYIRHQNHSWYHALGASGAVSAVTFAAILFAPMEKILLMGILPIPGVLFGVLYLVYSSYMARRANDNIGHEAHFYGAIFGLAFTLAFKPQLFTFFITQVRMGLNGIF